jgi:xylitol oxidase
VLNTTAQGGVPGPWLDRLPHFVMGFTPSNGSELQSEFFVARADAPAAITALRAFADRIGELILVTELRTMAADELWLSGAYGRDTLGIHFTWQQRQPEVEALLVDIEAALAPFGARPHWGKVFTAEAAVLAPRYPRYEDFRGLVARHDPEGVFRNEWLTKVLGD